MKTLELNQMEIFEGGFSWWKCGLSVGGGALLGYSQAGNGIAFLLGPVGVTFTALGAIGGALVGAAAGCFE